MVKKISIILVLLSQQLAYAGDVQQADMDAFYARQRKEKHDFLIVTAHDTEECKSKFTRWFKSNDPDAEKFQACQQAVEQKINLYMQMQAQEACTTFRFRCN